MELTLAEFCAELEKGTRAIFLVRHAERKKMDPQDPTFGDTLPITPEGVRTATLLGQSLAPFRADVQFAASPLLRTRMTAACIADGMGLVNPAIPTDDLLGNGSFYYDDPREVLVVFTPPENFFPACFAYYQTGHQRGFHNLFKATDAFEDWLQARFTHRLFVVTTHDCYIAAFYAARTRMEFTRANWIRFLDAAAILIDPDGTRRYALVRTGLSDGICGIA